LGAAFSHNSAQFIAASFLIGIGSVAVQIIIPYAAGIAPQEIQGRVVGYVMSGLLLGVMLARPLASIVTELTSWHTIFIISAVLLTLLMAVLYKVMPKREPRATMSYGALISSMGRMLVSMPVLRRRAVYQAALFSAFSLFWTGTPMYFMGDAYGMTQAHIALFGLVGAAGVIAAPIAGRIADKGVTKFKSAMAILTAGFGLLLPHFAGGQGTLEVLLLAACAVVLDFGAIASQVMGQRVIFSLGAEYRSRVNGVYMAAFFCGGAFGSALGGYVYAAYGFYTAMWTAFTLPVLAFIYLLTEPKGLYAKK
jgi:predicted MFS family arabinose efflux permease